MRRGCGEEERRPWDRCRHHLASRELRHVLGTSQFADKNVERVTCKTTAPVSPRHERGRKKRASPASSAAAKEQDSYRGAQVSRQPFAFAGEWPSLHGTELHPPRKARMPPLPSATFRLRRPCKGEEERGDGGERSKKYGLHGEPGMHGSISLTCRLSCLLAIASAFSLRVA